MTEDVYRKTMFVGALYEYALDGYGPFYETRATCKEGSTDFF